MPPASPFVRTLFRTDRGGMIFLGLLALAIVAVPVLHVLVPDSSPITAVRMTVCDASTATLG